MSEFFVILLEILLEKDNEEMIDGRKDENILIELFILIVTRIDNRDLFTSYKFVKNGIIYDKIWDKIIELFINNEVKEKKVKKSGIDKDKINSSKKREGHI